MATFKRHILTDTDKHPSVFYAHINGDYEAVQKKALTFRLDPNIGIKVGIIGSGSRVTQAIQGGASIAIPGDMSDIRSPVRSRIYSALTPGGGGGRRVPGVPGRQERGYRCPEGFQFGGRFTDNRYSTCGQMLFDLASIGRGIGAAAGSIGNRAGRIDGIAGQAEVTPIRGGNLNLDPGVIQRAVQIPRAGGENASLKRQAVTAAASALVEEIDGSSYLVRADGFALKPVVSAQVLRTVPDNRNMENATYLMSATSPDSIGKDELGLLSNTGVTELNYVLPSGVILKLKRSRPLTTGERRKLGRTVNAVADVDVSDDPAARLKAVAADSNGGIEYSEDLSPIDKPNDLVRVGKGPGIRRWVAESFKKRTARQQARREQEISEEPNSLSEKITNLSDAVDHLNSNGSLADIDPSILQQALTKAKGLKSTKLSPQLTRHERADGSVYFEKPALEPFEHLSMRVSADTQRYLGLQSPNSYFIGQGTRRPLLFDHPRNVVGADSLKSDASTSSVRPDQMLALSVADWLNDERNRTPSTVTPFSIQGGDGAIASASSTANLAGLSRSEVSTRQRLKIDDFMLEGRQQVYGSALGNLNAEQQKLVVEQLNRIIERASSFNWDEYISRMMIDGKLSAAEKAHLELVRSLFGNRLETLQASKDTFLKSLNLG